MTPEQFKQTLAHFASGVTVLTWHDSEKRIQGITVSAFSSLSLTPPLVLFCIDHKAYAHPLLKEQEKIAINILGAQQTTLAYQFAGPNRENLEEYITLHSEYQIPYLNDTHATLIVRINEAITQGDHDIFIAEVLDSHIDSAKGPLLYHGGKIFHANDIIHKQ